MSEICFFFHCFILYLVVDHYKTKISWQTSDNLHNLYQKYVVWIILEKCFHSWIVFNGYQISALFQSLSLYFLSQMCMYNTSLKYIVSFSIGFLLNTKLDLYCCSLSTREQLKIKDRMKIERPKMDSSQWYC